LKSQPRAGWKWSSNNHADTAKHAGRVLWGAARIRGA